MNNVQCFTLDMNFNYFILLSIIIIFLTAHVGPKSTPLLLPILFWSVLSFSKLWSSSQILLHVLHPCLTWPSPPPFSSVSSIYIVYCSFCSPFLVILPPRSRSLNHVYYIAIWLWNMISYIKERIQANSIWKQDLEANIWAQEGMGMENAPQWGTSLFLPFIWYS